jgi:hypothetical protein
LGDRFRDFDFASDSNASWEPLFETEEDFRFPAPRPVRRPPGIATVMSVSVDTMMEKPAAKMACYLLSVLHPMHYSKAVVLNVHLT